MRLRSVLLLSKMFWLFIVRRVLGRGLLRSRTAQLSALLLVLLAFAGFCLMSFVIIRQYLGGTGLLEPILQVANASVGFWVLIVYTLIRVLFLKADELLRLSFSLPVTNKERTLAFTLFESSIVLCLTVFIFGAFSLSTVLLEGPRYIPKVLAAIWFPAVTFYLVLSLGYFLLERLLLSVGLARLRGLLVPMVLALGLALAFPYSTELSNRIVESHFNGQVLAAPPLVFALIQGEHGIWLAAALFVAVSAVLLLLIVGAAPRSYVAVRRFFKVLPASLAATKFGAYLLVLVRSFETAVAVAFMFVYTVFAVLQNIVLPPFVLVLITFQGIYAYSNSEPLRRLATYPGTALRNYLCLVGSQAVLFLALAVPTVAAAQIQGIEFTTSLMIVGFCLGNILISTLIGIAFPPEKGNPFTVLMGVVLTVIVVMIVALGLNIFNLSMVMNLLIFVVLNAVVVIYSILGMKRLEMINRHEMAA
ncbi:hypothetical protein [Pseudarthrobacter sulfonivorans]|uniref:hypothetical protein n=1 Tax=Pseudarthrobacter sulfonivorans TaxID=121292 RepID=UPI00210474D6|nr:hypothetical protein [Pseudarthrobacter sulfonivorans]